MNDTTFQYHFKFVYEMLVRITSLSIGFDTEIEKKRKCPKIFNILFHTFYHNFYAFVLYIIFVE